MDLIFFLVAVLSLLLLSGFFSGSETAFFSLPMLKKQKLARERKGKAVHTLLNHPRRLLITILIGNTLVNVTIASLNDSFFETHFGRVGILISIVISTILLLFLGEITPKVIAIHAQEFYVLGAVRIISFFYRLFAPLVSILGIISSQFLSLISEKQDERESTISREELKAFLMFGKVEKSFRSQEKQIIDNLLLFGEALLSTIKTPRTQMVTVSDTQSLPEILPVIQSSGYSRLPVYGDNPDNIIGVVYAKDLIPFALGMSPEDDIRSVIRQIAFVPEQQRAAKLFQEMVKSKQHMVITINEFGGVSGLVTLEDLIEEVVGEIYDEWEQTPQKIKPLPNGAIRVLADLEIDDFSTFFTIELGDRTSSTIGGFILEKLGRLPRKGERIFHENLVFIAESVSKTRIFSLLVYKREHHSPQEIGKEE